MGGVDLADQIAGLYGPDRKLLLLLLFEGSSQVFD